MWFMFALLLFAAHAQIEGKYARHPAFLIQQIWTSYDHSVLLILDKLCSHCLFTVVQSLEQSVNHL